KANAVATIDPRALHIRGNASVIADAVEESGSLITGSASVNARLNISAFDKVTIDGNVFASAEAAGPGHANAVVDFGPGGDVSVGGVEIGAFGDRAAASFLDNDGGATLSVGAAGLDVSASAISFARAVVDVRQAGVTIAGNVAVRASAENILNGISS